MARFGRFGEPAVAARGLPALHPGSRRRYAVSMLRLPSALSGMLLALIAATPSVAGERPSGDAMITRALAKSKQVVRFTSTIAPEEIERRMLDLPCGREEVRSSGIASVGTLFIPVSTRVKFNIDRGFNSVDGSRWLLLRADGASHISTTASGVRLSPLADGGSEVSVVKADKRKAERIRDSVEAGRLFCDWREFDYPYD